MLFFDPYQKSGIEKTFDIKRVNNLSELISQSDIVSINTPLTNETKGMVNFEFISKMKDASFLVNLSRGPIIENKYLIKDALTSGKLSGYGTDVWIDEPPKNDDQLYRDWLKNEDYTSRILITPHTAYYSEEALFECRNNTALNCLNYIQGKEVQNRII